MEESATTLRIDNRIAYRMKTKLSVFRNGKLTPPDDILQAYSNQVVTEKKIG
jgi:hypothetical protein